MLVGVHDDSREELVSLLVSTPLQTHVLGFAEFGLERQRHVVEQWPQHVVAVPVVVQIDHAAAEVDGHAAAAQEERREGVAVWPLLHEYPGPADPKHLIVVAHAGEGADEAAGGLVQRPLAVGPALRGDGQAVGGDDEALPDRRPLRLPRGRLLGRTRALLVVIRFVHAPVMQLREALHALRLERPLPLLQQTLHARGAPLQGGGLDRGGGGGEGGGIAESAQGVGASERREALQLAPKFLQRPAFGANPPRLTA
mmetsp:Transcript_3861/g.9245  ORF Transcript_3861/g.9245 Transcript_3861/m.9245 type:complete len:255 (+) Transcript_3861:1204-1968(+)